MRRVQSDGDAAPDLFGDGPDATRREIEAGLEKLSVREGDVVLGRYRLLALLAASVTGAVFIATHIEEGHEVAVKLLIEPYAHDPEVRARFAREANLLKRIESDHVVRIIDVGELQDGTPVIAMESLRGDDLRQLLRGHPEGMPVTRAVDLVLDACVGLAAAHACGIVHRDVKPANLFIAKRADGADTVKLIDFGIAKAYIDAGGETLTNPTSVVGSPRYMAPEQITAPKQIDARVDVWALATILFELLTGRPLFDARGVTNVLDSIVHKDVPSLLDRLPSAPRGLADVLARALSRDKERRTPDVATLARELVPFASPGADAIAARVDAILKAKPPTDTSPRVKPGALAAAPAAPVPAAKAHARTAVIVGVVIAVVAIAAWAVTR